MLPPRIARRHEDFLLAGIEYEQLAEKSRHDIEQAIGSVSLHEERLQKHLEMNRMNQPNSVPGFRPDLLSPDYEAGRMTDYVPRPKTAIESMELVSDLPTTSIAERVAARSELRGYDIGQHPQVSDHLAKVAFARLHGEPPYDTV